MSPEQAQELQSLADELGYRWARSRGNGVSVLVDYMEWTGMGSEPATAVIMDMSVDRALVALRAVAGAKHRAETIPQLTEAEAQWIADGLGMHHERRHDVKRVVNMVLEARSK
jgi:hypothetical protein